MRFLFLSTIFVSSICFGQGYSQYKGILDINTVLNERLGADEYAIDFTQAVGDFSIAQLLGFWSDGVFKNGMPNPTNIMLWQVGFDSLIKGVVIDCKATTPIRLNDDYRNSLYQMCQWPAATVRTEAQLLNFWLSNMGYDAPESEFKAFKDFFLSSEYANKTGFEAVSDMMMAMYMNPHFLLRK